MLRDLLVGQALFFLLLLTRVLGFVLTSPFPSEHMPRTVKVGFALVIAFFCSTLAAPPAQKLALDMTLVLPITSELGLGLVIGFAFRLLMTAADVAGDIIGQATGLGSASLFNPMAGTHETPASRVVSLMALMLMLSSGAHRVVIAYLIDSFVAIPVAAHMDFASSMPAVLDLFIESMAVGVRLAMPVVAVGLVVQIGLGMIARIAPTLQIFNMGFAILLVATLTTLFSSLRDIGAVLLQHVGQAPRALERIFDALSG
jgi:flagellar biosynthesis protein FliR